MARLPRIDLPDIAQHIVQRGNHRQPREAALKHGCAAHMVRAPADYPWPSHGHNALGREQALITPHSAYRALAESDETRRAHCRALVDEHPQTVELEQIRRCTSQQRVYGGEKLQRQVEALVRRSATVRPRGRPRANPVAER